MKKLTAAAFRELTSADPDWAATLSEEIEITECCNLPHSPITHLSPLLHFTGRDSGGNVANFNHCPNLKIAEGNFAGQVNFACSGIEKIGQLTISQPGKDGYAANFAECLHLKVAEGTFPGSVDFTESGIEKIGELEITQPDNNGDAANFSDCIKLKVAKGVFPGRVDFSGSGVEDIAELVVTAPDNNGTAARFENCDDLKTAAGTYHGTAIFSEIAAIGDLHITTPIPEISKAEFISCPNLRIPEAFLGEGYVMDPELRRKNISRLAARKAQKVQPEIEI